MESFNFYQTGQHCARLVFAVEIFSRWHANRIFGFLAIFSLLITCSRICLPLFPLIHHLLGCLLFSQSVSSCLIEWLSKFWAHCVSIQFFGEHTDIFQSLWRWFYPCSIARKIFTIPSDWLWIEVCQNAALSKIDITMTTIIKNLWNLWKPNFARSRPATENPAIGT